MLAASETYSNILNARFHHHEIDMRLHSLLQLEAGAALPALLSALRRYDLSIPLERTSVLSLLNLLLVAFVRIRVIGQLENADFERMAFRIAPMIAAKKLREAILDVKQSSPGDGEFLAAFKRASVTNAPSAHYLLQKIEETANPPSQSGIAPARDATLEHVYAQKPTAEMLKHDALVSRLGNLTLLGSVPNSYAQNAAFAKKKPILATSLFWINKTFAKYSTWDEKSIN